jgi:hypothetical protein
MRRPALFAFTVAAAVLPILALAAPVVTPVPVGGTFTRVESRGDFDVEVREGSPASVEIVAEPGMGERIQAEVTGGELVLTRKRPFDSAKGVLVKVVVPEFRGLSVGGSGRGTAESGPSPRDVKLGVSGSGSLAWKGVAAALDAGVSGSAGLRAEGPSSSLSVAVSGSGDADVEGTTGAARVAISGSGDVKLAGRAESLKVSVSGSGGVDAKAFAVKDANVSIAGSGDVELRLDGGTLDAQLAGSGDVIWSGEGKVGSVATAGSGKVRRR